MTIEESWQGIYIWNKIISHDTDGRGHIFGKQNILKHLTLICALIFILWHLQVICVELSGL